MAMQTEIGFTKVLILVGAAAVLQAFNPASLSLSPPLILSLSPSPKVMEEQEHGEDQEKEQEEDDGSPAYEDVCRAFLHIGLYQVAVGGVLLWLSFLMKTDDRSRFVASVSVSVLLLFLGLCTSVSAALMAAHFRAFGNNAGEHPIPPVPSLNQQYQNHVAEQEFPLHHDQQQQH